MKTDLKNLRFKIYARKSTESADRQVQSIDDQIKYLKELAIREGLNVIGSPIYESKSAKEPYVRTEFKKLIEAIKNGEIDGILCWKFDRLSRNPIDSGDLSYLLQKRKLKAIVTSEKSYFPEDNVLLISIEGGMSNQYIIDLSNNVKRGMKSKLEKGWHTAIAPQGYLNRDGKIVEDEERFPVIKKMWDLMLTGKYTPPSILEIANNKWGYRTRQFSRIGGSKMSRSAIYKLFQSKFYAGVVSWNGQEYPGSHKPMITMNEYHQVQELLNSNGTGRKTKKNFSFTGFIRCGECGCLITAEDKYKTTKSSGLTTKYIYYHCTHKKVDPKCSQSKNTREEELYSQMVDLLQKYTIHPQFREWAIEGLKEAHEKEIESRNQIQQTQSREVSQTQKSLDNLLDLKIRNLISDNEYSSKKATLLNELDQLKANLKNTENRMENWMVLMEKALDLATYGRQAFINGDFEAKKTILNALGSNWTLLDGKLSIQAHSWFQPIADLYPALEAEYRRLEPTETLINKRPTASLEAVGTRWLGR
jgi:site-specific DNA recombinase